MDNFFSRLDKLAEQLDGEVSRDNISTVIYATDASVYREIPLAVIWPMNRSDLKKIVEFASGEKCGITMRGGGTSLAGQVVSNGIIVDIYRYMNKIIEINREEMWARVEPGVVPDELNQVLKGYGLFFGPETSTSSRCNIGGMVGNNACGSHSLIYGSTRDHTIELKTILSDGSEALFGPVDKDTFHEKCNDKNLEGDIYRNINELLGNEKNRKSIREDYPDLRIPRRNTGYALDLLLDSEVFDNGSGEKFNFCKLLAGSEGTLAVITEIKLNLIPLPPVNKALICAHLHNRDDAFKANLIALRFNPSAVEMMDNKILDLTKDNISQKENRFFIEGDPGALLIVEFLNDDEKEMDQVTEEVINSLKSEGIGYYYPIIKGEDTEKVWELRRSGLGVLSNMQGDEKPVSLIEDTAIDVSKLQEYVKEVEEMMNSYGKEVVLHAHIGTGELHIRPVLNLKNKDDASLFRKIGFETAHLVKRYKGSLSGEHGDGRLRGEFIPIILGKDNYKLLKAVKRCWDRDNILNPGKITDTPLMNTSLRYIPDKQIHEPQTIYDFSSTGGIIRAVERCNGSADCRKSVKIGGIMCPSFMATEDEDKSTRARANVVREFLSTGNDPWDKKEIHEILDLCLACKGCKAECPSGVDIAKVKSEFLQHWYDRHGIPLRTRLIAHISAINRIGSAVPSLFNFIVKNRVTAGILKKITGFASQRSIPTLFRITLRRWVRKNLENLNPEDPLGIVCLFIDEFTNYNDTETGIGVIELLTTLKYKVITVNHSISARTFISKGLIRRAQKTVRKNIKALEGIINEDTPLLGIEPSAILGFRDEYPDLAGDDMKEAAGKIAANSYMIDEFISREFSNGVIKRESFTDSKATILLHAHCQQKAIASSSSTIDMLSIPINYTVKEIPTGCCGMAGSFGYEKEHYDLSNKIGELLLFPEIRKSSESTIIAAPGTSCRHHIKDGTGRIATHPAIVLFRALNRQ